MTNASRRLDAYDSGIGSMLLAWSEFSGVVPDSYNVYLDGVLNQNVAGRMATVTGLVAGSTHTFYVVAVKTAVEIAASLSRTLTATPTSVMLRAPMKRLFPFPNTGLD